MEPLVGNTGCDQQNREPDDRPVSIVATFLADILLEINREYRSATASTLADEFGVRILGVMVFHTASVPCSGFFGEGKVLFKTR